MKSGAGRLIIEKMKWKCESLISQYKICCCTIRYGTNVCIFLFSNIMWHGMRQATHKIYWAAKKKSQPTESSSSSSKNVKTVSLRQSDCKVYASLVGLYFTWTGFYNKTHTEIKSWTKKKKVFFYYHEFRFCDILNGISGEQCITG